MAEEVASLEELRTNLTEYEEQLEQVGQLLLDDPNNEEYSGLYSNLHEVVQLTKELIRDGEAAPASSAAPAPSQKAKQAPAPASPATAVLIHPAAAITEAPELKLPSVLPPTVATQIRTARQRAAIAGQAPAAWAIGAPVQAIYREDGQWYNAVISAVSHSGKFIVQYAGYDTVEELEKQEVRVRSTAGEDGGYTGVSAPKRRRVVEETPVLQEMPAWLVIKPEDDERTKAKKKKLQKSFKSKQRFAKMDVESREKANSWKTFVTGKGSKKKSGFMTGHKRDSIFRVPEEISGRVGVVGSGKGMTTFQGAQRHEFHQADQ